MTLLFRRGRHVSPVYRTLTSGRWENPAIMRFKLVDRIIRGTGLAAERISAIRATGDPKHSQGKYFLQKTLHELCFHSLRGMLQGFKHPTDMRF